MKPNRRNLLALTLMLPGVSIAQQAQTGATAVRILHSDNFNAARMEGWDVSGAKVEIRPVNGSLALQTQGEAQLFWGTAEDKSKRYQDVTIEGEVSVERNDASSGFLVRADRQANGSVQRGYWVCVRKLAAGYSIAQLFRLPEFALLQEARVRGTVNLNQMVPLKVTCQGPYLWVWAGASSPSR